MMLSTKLVLFLCFVGSVLAQFESICNYDCVQTDVYGPYCGGAVCVYGETDPSQHEQLCSQECADAILGKPMRDCVRSVNPNMRNLVSETRNMVLFIRVFCDNVGVDPIPLAPLSVPEIEPFTLPFELVESSPIDPPGVTPPTIEETVPEPAVSPEAPDVADMLEKDIPMATPTTPMAETPMPAAPMSGVSPEMELEDDSDVDAVDDLNEI